MGFLVWTKSTILKLPRSESRNLDRKTCFFRQMSSESVWCSQNCSTVFLSVLLFLSFSLSFVHSRIWGKRAYIHEGFPIGLYFPLVSQNNLRVVLIKKLLQFWKPLIRSLGLVILWRSCYLLISEIPQILFPASSCLFLKDRKFG